MLENVLLSSNFFFFLQYTFICFLFSFQKSKVLQSYSLTFELLLNDFIKTFGLGRLFKILGHRATVFNSCHHFDY